MRRIDMSLLFDDGVCPLQNVPTLSSGTMKCPVFIHIVREMVSVTIAHCFILILFDPNIGTNSWMISVPLQSGHNMRLP